MFLEDKKRKEEREKRQAQLAENHQKHLEIMQRWEFPYFSVYLQLLLEHKQKNPS